MRYYGCPAEEGGAAKGFMVRDGVVQGRRYRDLLASRAAFAGVNEAMSLANTRSISASPAGPRMPPPRRISAARALDAVELMNVGVNYMREHMPSDARVHYALLDAGGIAPNVVQASAKVRYLDPRRASCRSSGDC